MDMLGQKLGKVVVQLITVTAGNPKPLPTPPNPIKP